MYLPNITACKQCLVKAYFVILIKQIINPYKCLLKNGNFSIKTRNCSVTPYVIK